MLAIGSLAMLHHGLTDREPKDCDFICSIDEFREWTRANKSDIVRCVPTSATMFHVRTKNGMNFEFEIAYPGSTGDDLLDVEGARHGMHFAGPETLLALKMSHRYRKDSPHFLKTMRDIQKLREVTELGYWSREVWLPAREAVTYTNSLPKLNVSKEDFFKGDGVNYVYDHDELHKVVAVDSTPAYLKYIQDGEQVMTSEEKFWATDARTRLLGGLEESMVLALERSQIPHGLGKEGGPTGRWSFEKALEKVSTSITSGYFREFCWEHYDEIIRMYDSLGCDWYIEKFREAQESGKIIPRNM